MDYSNMKEKMEKTVSVFSEKLSEVRAGRANPALLNGINASYYGVPTPIQSLANITVPEARSLMIKPFDKGALKEIERAINEANIGITPVNNGEMIILTVPELTEEKRKEYVKMAKSVCEEAKVALRNIRQDANNDIKKQELPEDEEKAFLNDIQDKINEYNKKIDEIFKEKETELMRV